MAEIETAKTLLDEVKQFTDEKWRHQECERCGIESWSIYPDQVVYTYLPIGGEDSALNILPQPSRRVLPVSCRNCGNVRLIDTEVFERWRAAKKAETTRSSN